jgi:hypothetical protein
VCILAMQRPGVIACLSNKSAHFRKKRCLIQDELKVCHTVLGLASIHCWIKDYIG